MVSYDLLWQHGYEHYHRPKQEQEHRPRHGPLQHLRPGCHVGPGGYTGPQDQYDPSSSKAIGHKWSLMAVQTTCIHIALAGYRSHKYQLRLWLLPGISNILNLIDATLC